MVERIAYQLAVHRGFRAVAVLGQDRWLRVRVVSVLLGLLLFTSAVLKTHQLATEPVLGTGLLESRWFLALAIQYELLLGFWLMSGLSTRNAWYAALATFAAFAMVAAWKVVAGDASCGCFGRVETAPWLVLSVDACAIMVLCWCRVSPAGRERVPPGAVFLRGQVPSPIRFGIANRLRAYGWLVAAWFTTAMGLAFFAHPGARSEELAHVGTRIGDLIIVEPERMQGQPFELGKYIDIGDELAHGRWVVILYRIGCPECDWLIAEWPVISRQFAELARTALVAAPPRSRAATSTLPGVSLGELSNDRSWLVKTPTVLVLVNNRVLDVCIGFDPRDVRLGDLEDASDGL